VLAGGVSVGTVTCRALEARTRCAHDVATSDSPISAVAASKNRRREVAFWVVIAEVADPSRALVVRLPHSQGHAKQRKMHLSPPTYPQPRGSAAHHTSCPASIDYP
jgi:hypothetical protein